MTADQSIPIDVAFLDLLRERRSPSVFDPRHELSGPDLASLLEAARWSPSCGNAQPWAFVVARRGDAAHAGEGGATAGAEARG